MRNKYIKNIQKILIIFVVLHITAFAVVAIKQCSSGYNIKARLYMSGATVINFVYVIPIQRVFGWNTPVVNPFKGLKNVLYQKGLLLLLPEDGEREIWWYMMAYPEYVQVISTMINGKALDNPKITVAELEPFLKVTEDFYIHFEPFATMKIRDPKFRKMRLNLFNALLTSYDNARYIVFEDIQQRITNSKKYHYVRDKTEMARSAKILKMYLELKEYSLRYEKDSYDYFFFKTSRSMYDSLLIKKITKDLLYYSYYNNKLDNDNPYVDLFGYSYATLKSYYNKPISSVDAFNLEWATGYGALERKLVKRFADRPALNVLKHRIETGDERDVGCINEPEQDKELNED